MAFDATPGRRQTQSVRVLGWPFRPGIPLIRRVVAASRHQEASSGCLMAYRQLWGDLTDLRRHNAHLLGFLGASALFQDGLAGVFVFFPVLALGSFGFHPADLLIFEVAIMAIGAAGAVAGGILAGRLGPKVIIVGSLTGVVVTLTAMLLVHARWALWICALVASIFIGPTQAAARSYLVRAATPQRQGELFGLYACTGRVVSFLAPAAFAAGVSIFGGQRWGMLGITAVVLAGLLAFRPVRAVDRTDLSDGVAAASGDRLHHRCPISLHFDTAVAQGMVQLSRSTAAQHPYGPFINRGGLASYSASSSIVFSDARISRAPAAAATAIMSCAGSNGLTVSGTAPWWITPAKAGANSGPSGSRISTRSLGRTSSLASAAATAAA